MPYRSGISRPACVRLWLHVCSQPRGHGELNRIVAVYSMAAGMMMLALWSAFWAAGAIPEMAARPWEIAMHLTAEFVTAGLLIFSGVGLWLAAPWATRVNVFASGMLIYSLIQSPGRYLQDGAMNFVALFAFAFLATVLISPAFKPRPPTP